MKRFLLLLMLLNSFLCYVFAQQAFNDCSSAYLVCSGEPVVIDYIPQNSFGTNILNANCSREEFVSSNSMWFKWEIKSNGNLGFTITPLENGDDIDFVLYRMNNGLNNCDQKEAIRCMASGENKGETKSSSVEKCSYVTGLSSSSTDMAENSGCELLDDNFLSEVQAKEGDQFALWVNNYYSSNGFILEFTGTTFFYPISEQCKEAGNDLLELEDFGALAQDALYFLPVYPNPAKYQIVLPIYSKEEKGGGEVQVFNIQGNELLRDNIFLMPGINDISINIEGLPVGIYVIKTTFGNKANISRFGKF